MIGVAISVILLGLVASFSPVIIATVASQLTRSWPVARALAVLAGVAIATALLELMALGLLAGIAVLLSEGNERYLRIGVDFAVGALLLLSFLRLVRTAPPDEVVPANADHIDEAIATNRGLKGMFVVGFTLMILNAKSALLIAAAVTQIRALNTLIEVAILLVLLYLVVNLLPSLPVVAYIISPRFAAKIPEFTAWSMKRAEPGMMKAKSIKVWLLDDHAVWVKIFTLCAGLLLFARGINLLAR